MSDDPAGTEPDIPEFTKRISVSKISPIYGMHGYHLGKKPHEAVQGYIDHYTCPGELILDPFCGSGSTALAALLLGRKAVAMDASPAAAFITRFYLDQCDPDDLKERFTKLCRSVAPEMEYLYGTECERCGGAATIRYVIYSNVYECPECGVETTLFEAVQRDPKGCTECFRRKGLIVPITPRDCLKGYRPVAVNYACHGACSPKRAVRSVVGSREERDAFERIDLPRIAEIESVPIPYPHPRATMMHVDDESAPWGDEWRPSRNFRRIADLFTSRNLRAVAALFHAAGDDDDLRAVITSGMLAVTRKAQHLSAGGGYIPGTWALPPMSKQRNAIESLKRVFQRILKAKRLLHGRFDSSHACVSTQSAVELSGVTSESVDYIFTDPPYGGTVQYAELNFLWESWLGFNTDWHAGEIIVNRTRGKNESDWARSMTEALSECRRVLKPGRRLSLCFHGSEPSLWTLVRDIVLEAGFDLPGRNPAASIDTGGRTFNQHTRDKAVRRDLVVTFTKPRVRPHQAPRTFAEPARTPAPDPEEVIRSFLSRRPGSTKDVIYDHTVGVIIRSGAPPSFNFEKALNKIAEAAPGNGKRRRWRLKRSADRPARSTAPAKTRGD